MISDAEQKIESEIHETEKKLREINNKYTALLRKLRYKEYEQKALAPFLNETKGIRSWPLYGRKKELEFQIATQAYTPRIEKEMLKELKSTDSKLDNVKEIEKARRRSYWIGQDITMLRKEAEQISAEQIKVQEELKKLNEDRKTIKILTKRGVTFGGFKEHMVSLGDIMVVEKEK